MVDCINWGHHFPKGNYRHSIWDWLKYDPSLPRHSRSQPGILDCLLVQISQQHGCLFGSYFDSCALWDIRAEIE
ncbi:unnamed protein product [Penicillium nalgiovense]|nr:unnamed protein product [Penicillium nalgiovense]CAG8040839.1 unnamed protein product [Penicillium nalgiovense]CAG8097419.1 unnamed protein product [Penicillium nalgiovense]CAG8928745.1 unnamed protein product [Penicillium nalgiovense]